MGRRRLPGRLGVGDDDDSCSGQLGAIFIAGELLLKRGRMEKGRESHHQTFLRGKKTASNRTAKFRIVFSIIPHQIKDMKRTKLSVRPYACVMMPVSVRKK